MNMTSIMIKFRPSTVDGKEGGLYFQIIHNRVVRQLNTDYKVFAEEWDAEACLILKKLTCSTSKLMSVATKSSGLSRHTIEEKIEAVRQRIFQESSFRELQERHGICSATLSVWIKKYKAEVLRRFPVKDLPLYVLKYQETMTTEEENELTRLRRENEDLKLLHEANLLMIDMAKERFGIDIKKNYEEMLSGGCLKEVPGVKGNDE